MLNKLRIRDHLCGCCRRGNGLGAALCKLCGKPPEAPPRPEKEAKEAKSAAAADDPAARKKAAAPKKQPASEGLARHKPR